MSICETCFWCVGVLLRVCEEAPIAPTPNDSLAGAVLVIPFTEAFTPRGDELAATVLFPIKIISIGKGMSSCIFVSLKRGRGLCQVDGRRLSE
jgi:hypothetical protein